MNDIKKVKAYAKDNNIHLGAPGGGASVEALEAIEIKEALDRLMDNDDFKKIIEEGYMKDELRNLSIGYTNLNLSPDQRNNMKEMMCSIGFLGSYFRDISNMANEALHTVAGYMEQDRQEEIIQDDQLDALDNPEAQFEQDIS